MSWIARRKEIVELFHGTVEPGAQSILENGIDVTYGDRRADFGLGFYTTTIADQANMWARLRALEGNLLPAIIRLTIARKYLSSLIHVPFVIPTSHYWEFVSHNRSPGQPQPRTGSNYDVVYGPLAIPRTYTVWEGCEQWSFHSRKAQGFLRNQSRCLVERVL